MQPRSTLFQRPGSRNQSSGTGSSSAEVTAHMERENDELLKALRVDVQGLGMLAKTMGAEVRSHNLLLDTLHQTMDKARGGLRSTMTKLDGVSSATGVSHMWLLLVFGFFVFFFIFLLLKFR